MLATLAGAALGATQACVEPGVPVVDAAAEQQRTVRLVLVGNVAGALEPCGCTPDQLGGLDHLGALLARARAETPSLALLAVGSTIFADGALHGDSATQDRWKAETIASGLRMLRLTAWAPGHADFADGTESLARHAAASGAALLSASLQGAPTRASTLVELGPVRLGIVGLSLPAEGGAALPNGVTAAAEPELPQLLRPELARLLVAGANVVVGLAAMPRGAALRVAERLPELDLLAIADPAGAGLLDDEPLLPTLVGPTLVVQGPNHLQRAVVVDVVWDTAAERGGSRTRLRDLGGIARASEIANLSRRARELELRLGEWQRTATVTATDLAARRRDLEALRRQLSELEQAEQTPAAGSGLRYVEREIRESLGTDDAVTERMTSYYRRVNDHNRELFAGREPPAVRAGEQRYVGQDACTASCHVPARRFCDTRPHARAYETLRRDHKEYNLECVGCHVTGYEKPGGATVTHNELLRDVQCEECHGPGSDHVARPNEPGLTIRKADPTFCAERCHHPPHVATFDVTTRLPLVLGPGHGGS